MIFIHNLTFFFFCFRENFGHNHHGSDYFNMNSSSGNLFLPAFVAAIIVLPRYCFRLQLLCPISASLRTHTLIIFALCMYVLFTGNSSCCKTSLIFFFDFSFSHLLSFSFFLDFVHVCCTLAQCAFQQGSYERSHTFADMQGAGKNISASKLLTFLLINKF